MITDEKRKELAKAIHANAVEKGFWDKELSTEHYLMLVITEMSEAVEADRKGKYSNVPKEKENTVFDARTFNESNSFFVENFEKYVKDTVEDELADAYIRLLDLVEGKLLNIASLDFPPFECTIERTETKKLTETIFTVVTGIIEGFWDEGGDISEILHDLEVIAEVYDIDLLWHIESKMKYNKLRPALHGKKY